MAEKQRRYCKNKTPGTRRGRKWDEETRTGVLMDMITSNNICAVARKWGVPESTIRTWQAEELKKPESVFEQARREYARQVAAAAASAALDHIGYISRRVSANRTNAEIYENLKRRLQEDARARKWENVGQNLRTEEEKAAADACGALVVYGSPGSYDRSLTDEEREEIAKLMELHVPMDDRSAAVLAQTLVDVAARAAAIGTAPAGATDQPDAPPVLYMADLDAAQAEEVDLDE